MKDLILHSAIAEMSPEDSAHPGLRTVKFIFCDDQPNENKQGIEYEDFAQIKASAIGTPIKMKFIKGLSDKEHAAKDGYVHEDFVGAGGHLGSIPIGFIKSMYEQQDGDINQLVAEATLFSDEYPEEIAYLAESYAAGKAPGISWELKYNDSIIKNGIEWLKGLITRAATFVRHPAYGNRTAILALASNKSINEEQMMEGLSDLINDNSPKITDKGGNNRMDEELKKLQDQIEALTTSLSEKDTKITDLEKTVNDLTTASSEKDEKIAEYETKERVASRIAALVEAGVTLPTEADKLAAKQAFIAKMDDESFAEYKDDLTTAIAASKKKETPKEGLASRRPLGVPRFGAAETENTEDDGEPVTLVGLKTKMGQIARTRATAQSE